MNKTGVYKWVDGKVVKISDRVPRIPSVFFPKRSQRECGTEFCEHVSHTGERFSSRREKQAYLRKHDLAEGG